MAAQWRDPFPEDHDPQTWGRTSLSETDVEIAEGRGWLINDHILKYREDITSSDQQIEISSTGGWGLRARNGIDEVGVLLLQDVAFGAESGTRPSDSSHWPSHEVLYNRDAATQGYRFCGKDSVEREPVQYNDDLLLTAEVRIRRFLVDLTHGPREAVGERYRSLLDPDTLCSDEVILGRSRSEPNNDPLANHFVKTVTLFAGVLGCHLAASQHLFTAIEEFFGDSPAFAAQIAAKIASIDESFARDPRLCDLYNRLHVAYCPESSTRVPIISATAFRRALRFLLAGHLNEFEGSHLFPSAAAKLNHSCRPNCAYRIVERKMFTPGGQTVIAVFELRNLRPLARGEELTINYLGASALMPRVARRWVQARFKLFDCQCRRCVVGDDDANRSNGVGRRRIDGAARLPCTDTAGCRQWHMDRAEALERSGPMNRSFAYVDDVRDLQGQGQRAPICVTCATPLSAKHQKQAAVLQASVSRAFLLPDIATGNLPDVASLPVQSGAREQAVRALNLARSLHGPEAWVTREMGELLSRAMGRVMPTYAQKVARMPHRRLVELRGAKADSDASADEAKVFRAVQDGLSVDSEVFDALTLLRLNLAAWSGVMLNQVKTASEPTTDDEDPGLTTGLTYGLLWWASEHAPDLFCAAVQLAPSPTESWSVPLLRSTVLALYAVRRIVYGPFTPTDDDEDDDEDVAANDTGLELLRTVLDPSRNRRIMSESCRDMVDRLFGQDLGKNDHDDNDDDRHEVTERNDRKPTRLPRELSMCCHCGLFVHARSTDLTPCPKCRAVVYCRSGKCRQRDWQLRHRLQCTQRYDHLIVAAEAVISVTDRQSFCVEEIARLRTAAECLLLPGGTDIIKTH
eukprot:Clim_evm4s71 gene=Clim_evmTU4s71